MDILPLGWSVEKKGEEKKMPLAHEEGKEEEEEEAQCSTKTISKVEKRILGTRGENNFVFFL